MRGLLLAAIVALLGLAGGALYAHVGQAQHQKAVAWYCPAPPFVC